MELYLIRHGKTKGNTEARYIGTTDESLCPEGRSELNELKSRYEIDPELVLVSPMKRCRETAEILFPGQEQIVIEDFRECDFGEFENRNYLELTGNENYQRWIDSNGTLPFPGGESREDFRKRCVDAFLSALQIIKEKNCSGAAIVVHGGTIMSILDSLNEEGKSYFDYQVKNGHSYYLTGEMGDFQAKRFV